MREKIKNLIITAFVCNPSEIRFVKVVASAFVVEAGEVGWYEYFLISRPIPSKV